MEDIPKIHIVQHLLHQRYFPLVYLLLCKDVKTELSKVRRVEGQVPSVGGIKAEGRGGHLDLAPGEFGCPRLGV